MAEPWLEGPVRRCGGGTLRPAVKREGSCVYYALRIDVISSGA